MKLPIYLDYAATTPVESKVVNKMLSFMSTDGVFGNPASNSHLYGWQAEEAVDNAKLQIACLVNADPREIIFTSGATESNNLAIKGAVLGNPNRGRHIVTSLTEHKAVLDVFEELATDGFEVTYLKPDKHGLISSEQVKNVLREDTVLVSIMHVNNEIGVIQDIIKIGEVCRNNNTLFHVDAAQSAGKISIDIAAMKVDMMSFSAHKVYGPKGIGALYICRRPKVKLKAQIHGGGHQKGMRSGTLATHQIVGMGEAFELAKNRMAADNEYLTLLRDTFLKNIHHLDGKVINSDLQHCVPGIVNISFTNIDSETLMMALKDLAISSGSACTSASRESSHVLRAIGLTNELAHSSIRFSFGRYTTFEEVAYAAKLVTDVVTKIRSR